MSSSYCCSLQCPSAFVDGGEALPSEVVLLTKTDLPHVQAKAEAVLAELVEAAGHRRVLALSAQDGANVPALLRRTAGLLEQLDEREAVRGAEQGPRCRRLGCEAPARGMAAPLFSPPTRPSRRPPEPFLPFFFSQH